MNERYKMEYVNCEVSTITDTYENHELCAEEIVDRLNNYYKELKNRKKLNNILEGFLLDKGYSFKDIIKFLQEKTADGDGDK